MSYDLWRVADLGGPEPVALGDSFNYTSNCARMWREAGADLATFHGMSCADAVPHLRTAVAAMDADPDKYAALNPENGWGDSVSCRAFLAELLAASEATPAARWEVWR